MRECTRLFGIDAGHRVTKHESKCAHVHGHRYSIEVTVAAPALDDVGRVVDFGVVKGVVGSWLDAVMDHGYLAHPDDPIGGILQEAGHKVFFMPHDLGEPTAENIATVIMRAASGLLYQENDALKVTKVRVWETPNCYADAYAR
jgi:6-pyruvoyltetrahydropterin/6-carboxytetrahydropterin synthase